jgi:hypothetical protein
MMGYDGQGFTHYFSLASNEIITDVSVGFANINYASSGLALCYLQFGSNLRTYGPYDAGCSGTAKSYFYISSGVAYFSGNGFACISGLTLHYYI